MATYCLIINLKNNSTIQIGKLGNLDFKKGYYIYVGSALNSLEGRIKRHLRDEKKLFWHIDYLLNSPYSKITDIIFENSAKKWECKIAHEIAGKGIPVSKFGCSDCKCVSHLFYFKNENEAINACKNAFKKYKLDIQNFNEI